MKSKFYFSIDKKVGDKIVKLAKQEHRTNSEQVAFLLTKYAVPHLDSLLGSEPKARTPKAKP